MDSRLHKKETLHTYCEQRIKPMLLRERKTEALLIFVRTTLERVFQEIKTDNIHGNIGTKEDIQYINTAIKELYNNLNKTVVNAKYLQQVIAQSDKTQSLSLLAKKEKPLMVYYDSLVQGIGNNLPSGTNWIPELMVLALLSQWVLEEEKSTYYYPFLKDIDYINLLSKYDKSMNVSDENRKKVIMNMYKLSTILIEKLKNCTYKNSHKKKTKNRKRKINN